MADYRHAAKRKHIPPAGLAAQGEIRETPKLQFAYNPHLPPVLRFDQNATVEKLIGKLERGQKLTDAERGCLNAATNYAFAAGNRAKANHTGSFVWGDSTAADVTSAAANSVTMRASGGYRLFSNAATNTGVSLAAGGGSWTSISDRNAKENFQRVDPLAVLAKVAALPVSTWNYKSQDAAIRHIGPTAQDFKAAFGVGESETGITTIDADGVALAAIQGLNQKLIEREAEIAELKQRLEKLEQLLAAQSGGGQ